MLSEGGGKMLPMGAASFWGVLGLYLGCCVASLLLGWGNLSTCSPVELSFMNMVPSVSSKSLN